MADRAEPIGSNIRIALAIRYEPTLLVTGSSSNTVRYEYHTILVEGAASALLVNTHEGVSANEDARGDFLGNFVSPSRDSIKIELEPAVERTWQYGVTGGATTTRSRDYRLVLTRTSLLL